MSDSQQRPPPSSPPSASGQGGKKSTLSAFLKTNREERQHGSLSLSSGSRENLIKGKKGSSDKQKGDRRNEEADSNRAVFATTLTRTIRCMSPRPGETLSPRNQPHLEEKSKGRGTIESGHGFSESRTYFIR